MSATLLTRANAKPGIFLSEIGGLPPVRGAKMEAVAAPAAAKPLGSLNDAFAWVQSTSPSLSKYLRPQSAFSWAAIPYLSAMTPQYVQNLLIGALAGNHVPAYELFSLMIDTNPEIAACIGEYIDGISEKKLVVEPYHEEDEEPTDTAIRNQKIVSAALRNMKPDPANDENALRQTIRDILFSRFHGASVLNEDWFDTYGTGKINTLDIKVDGEPLTIAAPRCTYWVHPICYAWDVTGRLGLRMPTDNLKDASKTAKAYQPGTLPTDFGSATGFSWFGANGASRPQSVQDFPANQFIISILKGKSGSALGASDLRALAWWWIVSNFCGDWLLDLAQLFGIPFRKAKYQQGTPEPEKAEAREMLQNMGSRGWCLLDERVEVEFEKAMDQGASSPQAFMIELAERQFRKVILRQTMTGKDSSTGKGFGVTETDVKGQCLNAGAQFACEVLREQFARHVLMVNLGDDSELPFISMLDEDQGGLEEAQAIVALKTAGAGKMIGLKWLGKRFNIPAPGKDEETLADAAPVAAVPPVTTTATAGQPPKPGATPAAPAPNDEKKTDELNAAAETEIVNRKSAIVNQSAAALAEMAAPLVKYLKAGLEINDEAAQRAYFERAIEKWPELTKPLQHDTTLEENLTPALVKTFTDALAQKPSAVTASIPEKKLSDCMAKCPACGFINNIVTQPESSMGAVACCNPKCGKPVTQADLMECNPRKENDHK